MNNELQKLSNATRLLAECKTIDEAKEIHDIAIAARHYAKVHKLGKEASNHASEITLRAARLIGKMLQEKVKPGNPQLSQGAIIRPKLSALGITLSDSSRWQAIADLPQDKFEEHLAQVQSSNEELTTVGLVRLARSLDKQAEIEVLKEKGVTLPAGKYSTIVIDPPWEMQKIERDIRPNQVEFDYPTMNEEELKAFDLPSFSADNCHLYLWTTHKHLPLALRLVEHWGFHYQCLMVWHKSGGFQPFGSPQYNCEFIILARKGKLPFLDLKDFSVCFHAERKGHSVKPDAFYELVERVSPAPRIDVFARKKRDKWDVYGNEV